MTSSLNAEVSPACDRATNSRSPGPSGAVVPAVAHLWTDETSIHSTFVTEYSGPKREGNFETLSHQGHLGRLEVLENDLGALTSLLHPGCPRECQCARNEFGDVWDRGEPPSTLIRLRPCGRYRSFQENSRGHLLLSAASAGLSAGFTGASSMYASFCSARWLHGEAGKRLARCPSSRRMRRRHSMWKTTLPAAPRWAEEARSPPQPAAEQ